MKKNQQEQPGENEDLIEIDGLQFPGESTPVKNTPVKRRQPRRNNFKMSGDTIITQNTDTVIKTAY